MRRARDLRGPHVFPPPLGHDDGAHDAGIDRPVGEAEHQDDGGDGRARDAEDGDGEDDHRDGELRVGDAHDDRVGAPAEIAGDRAERAADEKRDGDGGDADQEGIAQADEAAHQHVAADLVGTERVRPAPLVAHEERRQEARLHVHLGGVDAAELRVDRGGERQDQEQRQADAELRRASGPVENAAAERAGGAGVGGNGHGREGGVDGAHQYSSLGSMEVAARSTRMLMRTKIALVTIAMPWISGKSRCRTALIVRSPRPG